MALKASAGVVNTGQRSTSFLSHDRRGGYRGRILASCSVLPPTWHRFLAPVAPVRKGASAAATRRRGGVVCRAAASGESETLIGDALAFLENRFPQVALARLVPPAPALPLAHPPRTVPCRFGCTWGLWISAGMHFFCPCQSVSSLSKP